MKHTEFEHHLGLPCVPDSPRKFADLNVQVWIRIPYAGHVLFQEMSRILCMIKTRKIG